jgi:hypothetical protein
MAGAPGSAGKPGDDESTAEAAASRKSNSSLKTPGEIVAFGGSYSPSKISPPRERRKKSFYTGYFSELFHWNLMSARS